MSADAQIASLQWNADHSCFTVAHTRGYCIYTTLPLKRHANITYPNSEGLQQVNMLERTNFLALIGGGLRPHFPANKMMLWDDYKAKVVAQLEYKTPVLQCILRRDCIVVALLERVFVYSFASRPALLAEYQTADNSYGIHSSFK